MAIVKSFNGSSIRKPGAYSASKVSPDSGTPLESNDTLLIIGEAAAGPSGASEGIQSYSSSAYSQLVAKYRTGPIVDCAKAALVPSRTPGVSGVGRILVYKTNASVQASLDLANTYGTVTSLEYGVGGNRITYKNTLSSESEIAIEGTAPVTNFAGLDTLTLILGQNGDASETVTFSSPTNLADVITQIEAQTTGLTASDAGLGVLKIEMDLEANGHRSGRGRSLELIGGTALGDLFLTAQSALPEDEYQASLVITQPRDGLIESVTVGGEVAMSLGRDSSDSCTAATVTVTDTSMTLTATGSSSYTLAFEDYPLIRDLVNAISALDGWSASASATVQLRPSTELDNVSAIGAYSDTYSPARIKRDAQAVAEFFDDASLVALSAQATKGLPDQEGALNLTGGLRGASSSSNFDAGFAAALGETPNVILPAISQDASADILLGLTDAASTYDIETVHAQLDTHLILRGNINNRKEAQGMVGYRKAAKADVFEQSATLNSALTQMFMQDVQVVDSSNVLTWKQPHVHAALAAGIRLGTEVGEPLTHKFLNAAGIGHYVNASTGVVGGDFDPLIHFDEAIDAGVTFAEPASAGYRIAIDNTTYGIDSSFVYNRGSVVEAAQYIAKTVRTDAELAFIGQKNAVVDATTIKSRIRTKLVELFEDNITTASDDAPQGFVEDTFIVTITGNTAEVEVEVKPVQGLDFIFITFTLGESTQSA